MIWQWSKNRGGGMGSSLLVGVLAAGLSGCAARQEIPSIVWPDPPETARVKYVGSVATARDVSGFSITDALVGGQMKMAIHQPMGLAVSEDGQRLYVADVGWGMVFVFDFGAKKLRLLGQEERFPLKSPIGVALDGEENVYVGDPELAVVAVYSRHGGFLRSIGKGLLVRPTGVVVDKNRQRLYVVDTGRNERTAHQVKVFDLQGNLIREIGRRGDGDGQFNFPIFAAVDDQGRLYVVDSGNFRVQVFDENGNFAWKLGEAGDRIGQFMRPKSVALDTFGNIYVADSRINYVQIFNHEGDLLLFFGGQGSSPGMFQNPTGITISTSNKIYVSDAYGKRVNIYQLINTTAEDSLGGGGS